MSFFLTLRCFLFVFRLIFLIILPLSFPRLSPSACVFFAVRNNLFLKWKNIFATKVAYKANKKQEHTWCNSTDDLP